VGVREAQGSLNGAAALEHTESFVPTRFVQDGKVLRGKDGWLFLAGDTNHVLAQHTGELLLDDEALERWRLVVESRERQAAEMGALYLFMIAPDTHAIYPEKLPDDVHPAGDRPVLQLCRHLADAGSPVRPIYLLDDLLRARGRRLVCSRVDTHWNDYGAFVAYGRILDEVERVMSVRRLHEDELIFYEQPMVGDLSFKLDPENQDTMTYSFLPNASARKARDNLIEGHGSVVSTECPDATGSCVLIGDSYGWPLAKSLAESFRRFTYVHVPTFDADFVAARRPDVIVNLVAERFLIHVPDDEREPSVQTRVEHKRAAGRFRTPLYFWHHTLVPSVESIERMRAKLLDEGRVRDATILSLLAYAGLQPAEIVALRWREIEGDRLTVLEETKPWMVERVPGLATILKRFRLRRARKRVISLVDEVVEDLERWRQSLEWAVEPQDFVFQTDKGGYWPAGDWRAWRAEVYRPLAEELGVESRGPYECRHVIAKLMINAGVAPEDLARFLGTTRERVMLDYAPLFHYAGMGSPVPVSAQIDRARRRAEA
jgi:alginate O-acetyltransferase complex protein AlgJ